MSVQVSVLTPPSGHPHFQRREDFNPTRIEVDANSKSKKRLRCNGSCDRFHIEHGRIGQILGMLESLQTYALDGEIHITVANGRFESTGELMLCQPTAAPLVRLTMDDVEEFRQLLKQECGEDLTTDQAWVRAQEVLRLFRMLVDGAGSGSGDQPARPGESPGHPSE